jgi:hypothetical protein
MDLKSRLFDQYGPVLTYGQLAKILDRTTGGLKTSLSRQDSESSRALRDARIRIGGRVYFRTEQVAAMLDVVAAKALS